MGETTSRGEITGSPEPGTEPEKARLPEPDDDIYSASDNELDTKKLPIIPDDIPLDSKKKKGELGDGPFEEPGPPAYAPPITENVKPRIWERRPLLLVFIGLVVLVIVLSVSLGVVLSKKLGKNHEGSGSRPSAPTSTISNSSPTSFPSATPTARTGNASPPIEDTAISVITIPDIRSEKPSLVQMFFQDQDLYLCSKTSTSGVETWPLSDTGTRIMPAYNSTPISVIQGPISNQNLPIRIFFINADGYLADIYQSTWGGPWLNGSLSNRQFTAGQPLYGSSGTNSVSAGWCDSGITTVYAMGHFDSKLYAFQLSGDDSHGNGGSWDVVWQEDVGSVEAVNIAAFCLMPVSDQPPPVFINSGGGLISWFNTTNVTVPLSAEVANVYRQDTPISTVYGRFSYENKEEANVLLLFFPLPKSPSASSSESLHILSATPYWSSHAPMEGSTSFYATEERLNWNDTALVDTGIVPRGSMSRAWTPLLMEGKEEGRVVVVYQDNESAIRIADVVGGSGNYEVIQHIS